MITRVAETRVEEIRVAERAPATKLSALMYRLQATLKTIFRSDSGKGPSFYFRRIFNSFSCSCEIADGESIMTSLPEFFFGKAITSRNEYRPEQMEQSLPKQKAKTPRGSAPTQTSTIRKTKKI